MEESPIHQDLSAATPVSGYEATAIPAMLPEEAPSGAIRAGRLLGFAMNLVVFGLALAMYLLGRASLLEAISFVTGAICVWLTVKESVWNFPISLLNVATFFVVYLDVHLFADAGLQIVYFILTAIGWYLWLHGGANRGALHVVRASWVERLVVIASGVSLTIILWRTLRYVGGSASFFDAITTAISLCAQWLLNRKRIENWYFWIAADLIYIPLYAYKGLQLTAILYLVFLIMCVIGLQQWRATLARQPERQP